MSETSIKEYFLKDDVVLTLIQTKDLIFVDNLKIV